MTRRAPWRGTRAAAAEPIGDTAQLLAALTKARNEKSALTQQLRDLARERDQLAAQVRSGAVMLAAARRQCAAGCEHARLAAERGVQLVEMQRVQNRLQAANQAYVEADLRPVPVVPKQRRAGR